MMLTLATESSCLLPRIAFMMFTVDVVQLVERKVVVEDISCAVVVMVFSCVVAFEVVLTVRAD